MDIWPTVLDLLGEQPLPNSDGRSLVPLLEAVASKPGEAGPPAWTRPSFAELDRTWGEVAKAPSRVVSVTAGTLQLISPASGTDDAELFDVVADPCEQHNLARDRPDALGTLRKRIADYQQLAPLGTPAVVPLDSFRLQELDVLKGGRQSPGACVGRSTLG